MNTSLKLGLVAAISIAFVSIPLCKARADENDFEFKVHNTTKDKITKLLASEDGKEYGSFDVGKKGIPAGETVTLKWDKKTNDSSCDWFIKAVFDDGSETPAKKFDFCDEDLELEF